VEIQKAEEMPFDVLKVLEEEGFIEDGEDNMVYAEKAFFAARALKWIRDQIHSDPDFDVATYLTMLAHYQADIADLTFSEDEGKMLYHLREPDKEVQELVESLIESTRKAIPIPKKSTSPPEEVAEPTGDEESADS
jgi:hypothetical protein